MLRVLVKILLFPLVVLLGVASLATKCSVKIGSWVGAIIINIFAVLGIINLIGKDIPCAAISGGIILLVLAIIFLATYIELLFEDLRDALKRI